MEMCIDTKKRIALATSSFWVALDARGRVWAFEVGERSEVGALESLSLPYARGRVVDYEEIPLSPEPLSSTGPGGLHELLRRETTPAA